MTEPTLWAIVPTLDLVEMTLQTCQDLLAQTAPTRVLLIDQGSSEESNDQFRRFAEAHHPRVLLWTFNPSLPSLSSAWNRGLQFVWAQGAYEALVVNSDVRLHPQTTKFLQLARAVDDALFVSALGVGEEQFAALGETIIPKVTQHLTLGPLDKGGPDFSCFLITQAGHDRYPFDEGFVPAFGEDCDAHRRYMLGGDGARIYSVNLPFHHIKGGSRTINQSPEARTRFEKLAQIGRQHYIQKWAGPPNQERFIVPGVAASAQDGVTNPELQARVQAGEVHLAPRGLSAPRELSPEEAAAALSLALKQKAETLR